MADPIIDAYSALEARMKVVDVITNNLANANTTGFKRDFAHILQGETGFDVGTQVDLSPGDMVMTGNGLDVAINGPGFFEIQTPDGVRYTRNGSFTLNANGELVTKDGMAVLNSSGTTINIGRGKVSIQDGGVVTVDGNEAATLKIVSFNDATKIQKEGLYRLGWNGTPDGVQDVPSAHVTSGALERSNVNAIDEMIHLMSAYREFEAVNGVVHTHSRYATAWAQANAEIPCMGTTHADYFRGSIPVTASMQDHKVDAEYEQNTGDVIVNRFENLDPLSTPAVLVSGHGPFCWGASVREAAHNAVILEELAHLACLTFTIKADSAAISDTLRDKHFFRKHGANASYGQNK